jgi:alanine dehydrogenase
LQAVTEDESLRNGVCCYRGHLTHALSAEKKGLPYRPVSLLLEAISTAA